MTRYLVLLLLLAGLLLGSALPAAAQDRTRETRSVDAFTEVGLSVPGTLHLRQGTSRSVEVEAAPTVLEHLETTVDGGRLEIRDASNWFDRMFGGDDRDWGPIDVYVTAPTYEVVALAGSGAVVGETPLEGETLALKNAGSGRLTLEVAVRDLTVSIAGSGAAELRGTAETVAVEIAGSGTVDGLDLRTATATIDVAGSGDTHIHVTDRLSATLMGSGDVTYRGSPTTDTSILGSGRVRAASE
jgi:hypothetical protein